MPKKKILVVDDEKNFTHLVKLALSPYEILEENDSMHAIEAARQFQPDLILLDIIMPGMDGSELATQMRADPLLQHTPIVFLTAIISPTETSGGATEIGGFPVLAKPVNKLTLIECIEKHLPG